MEDGNHRQTENEALDRIQPTQRILQDDQLEALTRTIVDEADENEVAKTMGVTRRVLKRIIKTGLDRLKQLSKK